MNKRRLHELNAGSWYQLSPRYRILHWYEMTSLTLHLKNSLVGWLQPKCKDTVTLTRLWIPAISKEDDIEDMTYVFLKPWLSFFRILYYFMYFGVIFPVKIVVFYKLPGGKIETWVMFCKNKMLSRSVFDFNFTRQLLQKRWCLQTAKTRLLLSCHYSPKTTCSLNVVH